MATPCLCRRPSNTSSRVADRVLVLWPGVRPASLRWESRVQDIGAPETSQLHVISKGESSPRDLHLNTKTQLHSTTSKLQTISKTGTQPHTLAERLPKIIISSHTHQNTPLDAVRPPERQDPASSTRTQALVPFTRKPTQLTEPTLATGGRHQKQWEL